MPYTEKQLRVAQAIEHGWEPKGAARGFAKTVKSGVGKGGSFADLVVKEGAKRKKKKNLSKYGLDK